MPDDRLPGVVKIPRKDALKIFVAVEADRQLGVESPEWMIDIAKLVQPVETGVVRHDHRTKDHTYVAMDGPRVSGSASSKVSPGIFVKKQG